MKSPDSRQSCDVSGHCLKVMTPDKIRHIGRIFVILNIDFLELYSFFGVEISGNRLEIPFYVYVYEELFQKKN
jgi:hypothetical protein